MPRLVVARLAEELSRRFSKSLNGSRILLVGMAYKKNVEDTRESPGLRLMELLEERGAQVDYHDPFVPGIPPTRKHPHLAGRGSMAWSAEVIGSYDAALIATDHDVVDYGLLLDHARLVVDTRNVVGRIGRASDPNVARA